MSNCSPKYNMELIISRVEIDNNGCMINRVVDYSKSKHINIPDYKTDCLHF